ncbi:hypothetical protein FQA39_LY02634 [Lamprigera yunnana]|nr:hypothetical protein FQA39_LY02634 [Lamprigera yunnana]
MGDINVVLNVFGKGLPTFRDYQSLMICSLPCTRKGFYLDVPVSLSLDHAVFKPFQIWSNAEKMIFIRNQTKDKVIAYSWQSAALEGIVIIEAKPKKGILQPKESHAIIIFVNSFDLPCFVNIDLCCKLLDHSQHIRHKESLAAFYQRDEELAGQFTITEKGTFYPKNKVVVLPKPEMFFVNLSISVVILSTEDRDVCLNVEQQLQMSPQKELQFNSTNTFKTYCNKLISKMQDVSKNYSDIQLSGPYNIPFEKDNVETIQKTVECLIGDVVLSNMFSELISFSSNLYQPYYLQCAIHQEQRDQYLRKALVREKRFMELKQHMKLVESYLNSPQATTLDEIVKELIREGLYRAFSLGTSQTLKTLSPNFLYSSQSCKFRCPVCMHKQ